MIFEKTKTVCACDFVGANLAESPSENGNKKDPHLSGEM